MLAVKTSDQLGNQMFSYASVKTIAQKRGEDFCFVRAKNSHGNDTDKKYGNEIHTIFPNTQKDFRAVLPEQIVNTWEEPPLKTRKMNYQEEAFQVPENTLMIGHYISCRYFADNLEQVQDWFAFPEELEQQVQTEIRLLREKYPNRPLIAVHFRIGDDYVKQGFRLQDHYWFRAAAKLCSECTEPVFLLFYDTCNEKKGIINRFKQKYDCEICRGSLAHDLCMMSKCQYQIICNSSFSIMSAVLNRNPDKKILRPSVYPAGLLYNPSDCFADDWTVIPAHQSLYSRINYLFMCLKGRLLRIIRQ